MRNHNSLVRGSASREADAIKATVSDTAAAVQEINTKLSGDLAAPAPPAEAAIAAAPPAQPDSDQGMAKETPPAQPWPPVERTAVTERGAVTASPAAPPVPLTLPAVPDYGPQFAAFISTVIRNQEMMLRVLEQAVEVCNRQQAQIKAIIRELDMVNSRELTILMNR